ncbi:MAG: hypothetical protein AAF604_23550 [Acidobacteriota bacterium]
MRFLFCILLASALACTPETPIPPAAEPTGRLYLRLSAGTPLHESPAADSPVIGSFGQDGAIAVAEERPPWFRIATADGTAWVQVEDSGRQFRVTSPPPGPRQEAPAKDELIARARAEMATAAGELRCGPYPLVTDVSDPRLLSACDRLANQIEAAYERRLGVRPVGSAVASILLFDQPAAFRRFSATVPRSPKAGYAAHAGRGYVALYVGDQERDRVLETLVHELTHLLNRRAVGRELPRWLSEGLADALGDSAGESGLEPLTGVRGAEAEAARLATAYRGGRAGSVQRLVHLPAAGFDAEVVSFDYEQSALLVRFLLLEPRLATPFRAYLGELHRGRRYDSQDLAAALGRSWQELDDAFAEWLLTTASAGSVG